MKSFRKGKVALFGLSLAALCAGGVYASSLIANTDYEGVGAVTDVSDTLTAENFGSPGRYSAVTYNANSGAFYAGVLRTDNGNIQINNKSNEDGYYGVVTTAAPEGKRVESVVVTFASNTATDRTVWFFGQASAYSDTNALSNLNSGSESYVGGVTYTNTSSFTLDSFDNNDRYIAFRSSSGAVYLSSVVVYWTDYEAVPSITVDPVSLLEIGDTGTMSAQLLNVEPSTPITWSSSDSAIVSINSSTGAYEALDWGVATITGKITVNGVDYSSSVSVGVNGTATIAEVLEAGVAIGNGDVTIYSVTVEGTLTQLRESGGRQVTISDNDGNALVIYSLYENSFPEVSSWLLGDTINVTGQITKYKDIIEITKPTINSRSNALTLWAASANLSLDSECTSLNVTSSTWNSIATEFAVLDETYRAYFKSATTSDIDDEIADLVARYDHIVAKYGYSDFANRGVSGSANLGDTDSMGVIIPVSVLFGLILVAGITVPMVIRRRKED